MKTAPAPAMTPEQLRNAYTQAFDREAREQYPVVDDLEGRLGYAVDPDKLLEAARILACPVKANPPNWQHGRVLYAVSRAYLEGYRGRAMVLDIGTAKGFSALCLLWALQDAGVAGNVVSVDVIDPRSGERRNTVAEVDGYKTLREILAPWPESDAITFRQSTGVDYLKSWTGRIEIAFVDGKHTGETVWKEALLLADRQRPGDVVVFDDIHLPDVRAAVAGLSMYAMEFLRVLPNRGYAIARRK
jgi:predicted O-methyltransferase YrrM